MDITILVNVHPGELLQTSFNDSRNRFNFSFIKNFFHSFLFAPCPFIAPFPPKGRG